MPRFIELFKNEWSAGASIVLRKKECSVVEPEPPGRLLLSRSKQVELLAGVARGVRQGMGLAIHASVYN